jgi:NAD-dependent SIR2 family protein deacetylase
MSAISIAPHDRVFVLTGAGISAESGLPTFRASDGLWAGHRIEESTPLTLPLSLTSSKAPPAKFFRGYSPVESKSLCRI